MVKPDAVQHTGKVLDAIAGAGLRVERMRMCHLSLQEAQQFYAVHAGKPFYEGLTEFMSSGPVVAMQVVGPGAIKAWRGLLGPTDSGAARASAPSSLRAKFGTDGRRNAAHGSDAPETAAEELEFFFGAGREGVGHCARCGGTSLAVVKPHVLKEGKQGVVLDALLSASGLEVTAMQQVRLLVSASFWSLI